MSYYVISDFPEGRMTIYGVRGEQNPPPHAPHLKESLKGRFVSAEMISKWLERIDAMRRQIERTFLSRQVEMLDPLHDPMRLAKQVNTIANRLVQQTPAGRAFDDKLERASVELKSLVKASELLSDAFDLLAIYFNPEAARFGATNAIQIHGLLTKLVSIFRIDDGGLTRSHARIFLDGSCYRNVFVHESFKLIPFSLLSNAVKYSLQGDIRVTIIDQRTAIEVGVESVGPPIEDDEKARIFEKRHRGRWAEKLTTEGRGVGLYLAGVIAKAHGFEIRVSSRKTGKFLGDIPLAVNRFSFEVPVRQEA